MIHSQHYLAFLVLLDYFIKRALQSVRLVAAQFLEGMHNFDYTQAYCLFDILLLSDDFVIDFQ